MNTQGLLAGKRGVVFGVANRRSIAWACAKACAEQGADLMFSFLGESQERALRKLIEELPRTPVCVGQPAAKLDFLSETQQKRVSQHIETLPRPPAFACDVSKDADIAAFFNKVRTRWGALDFVIHSVAFAKREDLTGRFVDTQRDSFALALDISAYSLVAVSRAAAPFLNPGGSVVAMTYYGSEKVVPYYNVMGVAKAALEASARYLAADLGPQGVRVNCISAGPIRTLSASALPGLRKMLEATEKVAPLRRNTDAEEVAKTAVYLLSDLASGVTGEVVHVDCGYNILGVPANPE